MRKYIPFGLVVILIGLLLVPLFATAVLVPSYTYYSDGDYDGGLWYSADELSSEIEVSSQESYITACSTDNEDFQAQTFSVSSNIIISTFWVYMTKAVGFSGSITCNLTATVAGVPSGAGLAYGTVDNASIPLVSGWVEIPITPYSLNAGTTYAMVMIGNTTDNVFWWAGYDTYPNGVRYYSSDGGASWAGAGAPHNDMTFRLYGTTSAYITAHDSAVGNTTAGTSNRVGQWYFPPASGTYYIFREGLFFDTSNLITSDNIQSATLQVWMSRAETATDNFELTIVDGSSLNGPLQTSDYYELALQTDNLGSVSTATMTTTGYTTITLNAAGIEKISKTTYTKFGLRSSRDIAGTVPTGYEYIYLYSGKGEHPPILTVSYLIGGLGIPDEMLISNVYVVSGFQDPKDELFVWQNTLRFDVNPDVAPTEYFVVQLLNSSDNVIAQTIVNRWGWAPLSIYLDNVTATTILPWKSACSLVMTGSSLYGTPTNFENFTYEVQAVDWRGVLSDKRPLLDIWCKATAYWMEGKNGLPQNTYGTIGPDGSWAFDPLNPNGGPLFLEGIPSLDMCRPNLFLIAPSGYTHGLAISGAYAAGLYTAVWGTYWSTAFNDLASGWGAGLGGQWIIGGMLGGVIVMIGAVVRQKSADPNISLVVMGFGFVICLALGSIAMDVALVGTIIVLFVFLKQTFITTQ